MRQQLLQTNRDEAMGRLTARLLSSLDESQICATLSEELPKVGVPGCHVVFFEPKDGDPVAGSVI